MKLWQSVVWASAVASVLLSKPLVAQQSPADLYGDLFRAVQTGRLFPDGKTFADAAPKRAAGAIMADYRREQPSTPEALRSFVLANFTVPGVNDRGEADLRKHIRNLWPMLVRQPDKAAAGSSLLPMRHPYVVPGGRFREIYYWDSYFTMLGLAVDGQQPLVESMLANFTDTIERYGHVPNGMRSYYLGRSQPPFYALMLDLSKDTDTALAARRLAALKREYAYWMKGASCLDATGACARVVRMPDGTLLNRYWDDRPLPRDESFAEDVITAKEDPARSSEVMYRHLRAGAESGWDFSSRWLDDPRRLASIRTTDIVPVDLNSLMLMMEEAIAKRSVAVGDRLGAAEFTKLAAKRRAALDRYFWIAEEGRYADWDRATGKETGRVSAAMLFPLFAGAASPQQARAVAATARHELLAAGGLRTTPIRTGQQWDSPNGWAPLQWVAIAGLERGGQGELAREIAKRWLETVATTYAETGKMLEKYDVEERKPGGGGEYPTQDGFGWTNGVTSAILEHFPDI
ncbi:alpha,alpha-trehalase TreA [Sphingomonas jeddahensis]|uniref:Periplasmic trehalase n=1 Tax=Sphingomonas jeddahensis TaxID=1915074 RepID=A0A1V2EWD6_9SPHN|nr:alpha,alpha-trehalase TreA [Sphingomonas jeddahensis]ONF96991.1 Periplasmic trehalase precursor [Sphingomonas jeddahensis]